MMDLEGNFSYVSDSAYKMFGYTKSDVSLVRVEDLLTKESYELHLKNLQTRLQKEKSGEHTGNVSSILQHIRKNGEEFWAEVSANPVRDRHNKLTGFVGVTRDITERIRAEEDYKKLSVVIEQSPTSIVITNVKGEILYVNPTFCKVTGYAPREVMGKNPRILKSGETPSAVYADLWKTISRGEVWRGEFVNKNKKGETYWERAIIAPIKNSQNIITEFAAIKENISAQKIAEQQLIDSQERYKMLSDISLEGIIIHEGGLILDVNNSICRMTGYELDELVEKTSLNSLFTKESIEIIKDSSEKGYEFPYEITAKRKDGSTFAVEVEARFNTYKGRKVRVKVVRDISYQKKIEQVLRSSLKMNEMLDKNSEQEIINWSLEEAVKISDSKIGFFHFVNEDQKTISLQTWTNDTLKVCNVPDKKEHYPIEEAGTWVDSFYKREPVIHNDYNNLPHKKGLPKGHIPLYKYISLPVVENDSVKIIFGVGNKTEDYSKLDADILALLAKNLWMVIQRKRTEKALMESNLAKDKFFSIISHDLRSPIGSVYSLTEVLIDSMDEMEVDKIKSYMETIKDTVNNVYNLLDNMLLWARSHRSKLDISPQNIKLAEIVDEVLHVEKIKAYKKEIALIINIDDDYWVFADYDMLSTIFRNLISNAIKFTNHKGRITISAEPYNDVAILLCVEDNGLGISPEVQKKLFEIDETTTTKGTDNEKGTGLGLILCKEFVEQLGGKIWVESTSGVGTKFYFTMPIYISESID